MSKKYIMDNRKLFMYSYIYQVEEFFRKYNNEFYGAVLKNFFGVDEIPTTPSNINKEVFFNKNISELQFFDNNTCTIPFVSFTLNYISIPNEHDGHLHHKYTRIITLLIDDIKQASEKELELAYIKFIEFKKYFLTTNSQHDNHFSKTLQPSNRDVIAYAYIKRLEELFGVNRYNIQIKEDIYNKIMKEDDLEISGIKFERKVVFKTNKNGVKNKEYNPNEMTFYYCYIDYNEILKMNLHKLKEAHYNLDKAIKRIKKLYEDYVDERRRIPSKFDIRRKERGIDIV